MQATDVAPFSGNDCVGDTRVYSDEIFDRWYAVANNGDLGEDGVHFSPSGATTGASTST
jgi:hypothetical protein